MTMPRLPLGTWVLTILTAAVAVSTGGFAYATYNRLYDVILAGFDRKVSAIASAESVFIDGDDLLALLAMQPRFDELKQDPEAHPLYQKYLVPMREVWQKAGLTFSYTQALLPGAGQQCQYIVDATIGEGPTRMGHSRLGDLDTIPDDDWDVALRVQHDGVVAQTAIRQWQQWGLLKCGWAPVYGKDGTVKAQTGADVEITVIKQKTYAALFETLGLGVLAIVVAGAVSFRVARRLTRPLRDISEAALRVASGDYGFRCQVQNPREMRELSDGLNALGTMMRDTVLDGRRRMEAWQRERAEQTLIERLALPPYRSPALSIALPPDWGCSGYIRQQDLVLVWIGAGGRDQLDLLKRAKEIEQVAGRMLQAQGAGAGERLQRIFASRMAACAVIDMAHWSVRVHGDGLQALLLGDVPGHSPSLAIDLSAGDMVVVVPTAAVSWARLAMSTPEAPIGDRADEALDALLATQANGLQGIAAAIHRPRALAEKGQAA